MPQITLLAAGLAFTISSTRPNEKARAKSKERNKINIYARRQNDQLARLISVKFGWACLIIIATDLALITY